MQEHLPVFASITTKYVEHSEQPAFSEIQDLSDCVSTGKEQTRIINSVIIHLSLKKSN
jgi:hypothetical protein